MKLIMIGNGVGFLFAVAALILSVVSFPLLLDRDVGAAVALATSGRAVLENPGTMALWGLIVAALLVFGLAADVSRPAGGAAGAGARDLAPLSQGGGDRSDAAAGIPAAPAGPAPRGGFPRRAVPVGQRGPVGMIPKKPASD